jgi:peroxiredoxin
MSTMTQQDIQVGSLAPDFTLDSTAGKPFTLSAQRGEKNVLLAFFPMAFTSVCQTELCDFWNEMEEFERTGTRVVGISVDAIPSLKAFQQSANMKTELLSDFKREVSRLYGVLLEDKFFSKRAYFLIDKQGKVAWKHVEAETGHKRENSEILDQIRQLG